METEGLVAFMRTKGMAVVATTNAEGCPEAALGGMAATELGELVLDTKRTARKYANLQGVHRVAVVVGWDEGQTVQVEGVCPPADRGGSRALCQRLSHPRPGRAARTEAPSRAHIRITPGWVRATDFRPGSAGVREAAWA